jgi:DNA-binding MarR family transcriptional regulator
MTSSDPVSHLAGALGATLLRSNRAFLYTHLTAGSDDLDETLYPVLSGLARLGEATPTELAAAVGIDRTVVTKYAIRLEHAGLIQRAPHPVDRRAVNLTLTATGCNAIAESRRALREVIASATSDWEPARIARLASDLSELIVSVQHLAADTEVMATRAAP